VVPAADLRRKSLRFMGALSIDRHKDSSKRALSIFSIIQLFLYFKQMGIKTKDINGYTQELSSHSMVAQAIKFNSADVGLGLKAAAVKADLDYIPLLSERYDLVIPMEFTEENVYEPILDHLTSAQYRQSINSLAGYDPLETGDFREL